MSQQTSSPTPSGKTISRTQHNRSCAHRPHTGSSVCHSHDEDGVSLPDAVLRPLADAGVTLVQHHALNVLLLIQPAGQPELIHAENTSIHTHSYWVHNNSTWKHHTHDKLTDSNSHWKQFTHTWQQFTLKTSVHTHHSNLHWKHQCTHMIPIHTQNICSLMLLKGLDTNTTVEVKSIKTHT